MVGGGGATFCPEVMIDEMKQECTVKTHRRQACIEYVKMITGASGVVSASLARLVVQLGSLGKSEGSLS